jgi:hypothetical protein
MINIVVYLVLLHREVIECMVTVSKPFRQSTVGIISEQDGSMWLHLVSRAVSLWSPVPG